MLLRRNKFEKLVNMTTRSSFGEFFVHKFQRTKNSLQIGACREQGFYKAFEASCSGHEVISAGLEKNVLLNCAVAWGFGS